MMRFLLLAGAVALLGVTAGVGRAGTDQADLTLRTKLLQTAQQSGHLKLVQAYDCRNVSCKRLRSCAEACYKLQVCGQSIRDRDKDGIPCENLCRRRCPRN